MAAQYTYLALENDQQMIVDWFYALPDEKTISERDDRIIYYFRAMASKPLPQANDIDQEKTPLVWIYKPQRKRGTLWTDGTIVFTPTPFRSQFPGLHRISQSFSKWLKQFNLVFSHKTTPQSDWGYFLEAGIQNWGEEIFALPQAMDALRSGQYFVSRLANDVVLDTLGRTLQLREYHVDPA